MTDTPQHIYDLQLQMWLSKPPMERLRQFMTDNEALYHFWNNVKPATNPSEKVILSGNPAQTKLFRQQLKTTNNNGY